MRSRFTTVALGLIIIVISGCLATDQSIAGPQRSESPSVMRTETSGSTGETGVMAACPAGSQTQIANGSFEAPVLTFGTWRGASFAETGWHSSFGDMIEIWSNLFGTPAADGLQNAELNYTGAGSMWQDICVPAGTSLAYSVAHRGRDGGEEAAMIIIDLGADQLIGTPDDSRLDSVPLITGNTTWATYSGGPISSSGNPLRLSLKTVSPTGGSGNLVDNVTFGIAPAPPLSAGPLPGPAKTGDVINAVRGGQTVPLKFRFLDESKAVITDPDMVELSYTDIPCVGAVSDVKNTKASEKESTKPGLRYNADDQAFMYHWRTPSESGGCVLLEVSLKTLTDGASASSGGGNHAAWKFMIR